MACDWLAERGSPGEAGVAAEVPPAQDTQALTSWYEGEHAAVLPEVKVSLQLVAYVALMSPW